MNWCGEILEERILAANRNQSGGGGGSDDVEMVDKENCRSAGNLVPSVDCNLETSSFISDDEIFMFLNGLETRRAREENLLDEKCKRFQRQTKKSQKRQQEILEFFAASKNFKFGDQNEEYSPNQNHRKAVAAVQQYVQTGKLNTDLFLRDYDTDSLMFDIKLLNSFCGTIPNEELFLSHEYSARTQRIRELELMIDLLKGAIQRRMRFLGCG